MKIQRRSFPGGYYFTGFQGEPEATIASAGIPDTVAIPFNQGFGQAVPALVKCGDTVKAGQIIGRDDATISTPVHASVNGTVSAVKRLHYLGGKSWFATITPDGTTDWQPMEGHTENWSALPHDTLEELLYLSGVTALGTSGIPTRFNSSIIGPKDVKDVIVHHTDAEIFNTPIELLLQNGRLRQLVEGLKILTTVLPHAKLHLAINYKLVEWVYDIEAQLQDDRVSYYSLKPKYPQEQDEVLIRTLLKKRVPYNRIPADIGALTLTFQDVLHVYEAVVLGKPVIERLVTLAGPGFTNRPHIWTRIGTAVDDIIKSRQKDDKAYRIVLNSVMRGITLPELTAPVTREYRKIVSVVEKTDGDMLGFVMPGFQHDSITNTFVAKFAPFLKKRLTTNTNGEQRGCISCGFCSDCCPMNLYPNLLHRYAEREKYEEAPVRYGIFDCVDCNLCTYLCTSKIPVAEFMKSGKQKLAEEGFLHREIEGLTDIEAYRGLP